MQGYRYRKRWILTQKEELNSRHLNSHPPLFLVFTNVTIWFLEWDPELHLEETFKIICSNPFILQKEHRASERGSLQLVSGWVGSRTQASWLWAEFFSGFFFFPPLPGTKEELGKRFRSLTRGSLVESTCICPMEFVISNCVPVMGFVVLFSDSALDLRFWATARCFPRVLSSGQWI